MPPACEVLYREEVLSQDLPSIPRNIQARILRAIEQRLMVAPARCGSRLRRSLAGLWKLRVGDYRVIYEITGRTVRIWLVGHRKEAYSEMERRFSRSGN